jgi:hypothetical protein
MLGPNHGLGIAGHQLLGQAGGAAPGARFFARGITANPRSPPPATNGTVFGGPNGGIA